MSRLGIVTSARATAGHMTSYSVLCQGRQLNVESNVELGLYDIVDIDAPELSTGRSATRQEYEAAVSEAVSLMGIGGNAASLSEWLSEYGQTDALLQRIWGAAALVARAFVSGAPISVRFHNDGDGASGAIAMYRAFSSMNESSGDGAGRGIAWRMCKGIAYTMDMLYEDRALFGQYESAEGPLVIIIDFGSSQESYGAVEAAHGLFRIAWLDHHMPPSDFPRGSVSQYINPCDLGCDSNFTAGLLACVLARALNGSIAVTDLVGASLVSDHSSYAGKMGETHLRAAVVLDYITTTSAIEPRPDMMDSAIRNPEESERLFRHASGNMEIAMAIGMKGISGFTRSDGIRICVSDFGDVAKEGMDYPLLGRYASGLHDRLELKNGGRTITVVHFGSYISIRMSIDIPEIDLPRIIGALVARSNGAAQGGGHARAASIRADKYMIGSVLEMLMAELGHAQGQQ